MKNKLMDEEAEKYSPAKHDYEFGYQEVFKAGWTKCAEVKDIEIENLKRTLKRVKAGLELTLNNQLHPIDEVANRDHLKHIDEALENK